MQGKWKVFYLEACKLLEFNKKLLWFWKPLLEWWRKLGLLWEYLELNKQEII
jgi:hypothetical protein